MIASLFPASVVTAIATPEMWEAPLHPEEAAFVTNAATKRAREFRAGRSCARWALAKLGIVDPILPVGPDRLPVWPEGIVGTISHCDDLCVAAVARQSAFLGLGLDVERAEPLSAEIAVMVGSEEEIEAACRATGLSRGIAGKLLFGIKEAAYKCCFPLARAFWDFHHVEIELDPGSSSWSAALPATSSAVPLPVRLVGRYQIRDRWILTGTHLEGAAAAVGGSR